MLIDEPSLWKPRALLGDRNSEDQRGIKHMCCLARKKVVQRGPEHVEKEQKPSSEVLNRALELAERKTQSMLQYRSSFENRVGLMLSLSSAVTVAAIGLAGSLFTDGTATRYQCPVLSVALILMIAALFFEILSVRSFKGWLDSPNWDDTYSNSCLFQEEDDYVSQCIADMKRAFAKNNSFIERRAILFELGLWSFLAGTVLFASAILGLSAI